MSTKMIFAVGPDGEFGYDEGLPWNVPEDLEVFKSYTRGCTLVMSGATFRSLPCNLPGRNSVVLSDSEVYAINGDEPNITLPMSVDLRGLCEFLDSSSPAGVDVCVIGGRKLLVEASSFVGQASISRIGEDYVSYEDENLLVKLDTSVIFDNLNSNLVLVYNTNTVFGSMLEWQ